MAATQLHSGSISVALRCRDCSHEWRYEMPVATDRPYNSILSPAAKPTA